MIRTYLPSYMCSLSKSHPHFEAENNKMFFFVLFKAYDYNMIVCMCVSVSVCVCVCLISSKNIRVHTHWSMGQTFWDMIYQSLRASELRQYEQQLFHLAFCPRDNINLSNPSDRNTVNKREQGLTISCRCTAVQAINSPNLSVQHENGLDLIPWTELSFFPHWMTTKDNTTF